MIRAREVWRVGVHILKIGANPWQQQKSNNNRDAEALTVSSAGQEGGCKLWRTYKANRPFAEANPPSA